MTNRITKERDRLDRIVEAEYGHTKNRIVERVIEANPGIEGYGILLPRNIQVVLPIELARTTKPDVPVIAQISLWD